MKTQFTKPARKASYTKEYKRNLKTGLDGSTYTYDAQNRLLTAPKTGSDNRGQCANLDTVISRNE